ncbi:NmrA family NAD(P)-binding protein [Pseudomonas gingeri]|uniref:NmrA family NAD(P)-binding protein n=1 Tax=Pseudomonas gingeri TaxID=117681 RepID=A0A7Y8C1G8_9PSED|nr:NmrA family NAD(P)-binding protein [Pseudomonas gingeri]NWB96465.1 NmrA family NAD(P)-binding protein [Pseudomonas gingeri]
MNTYLVSGATGATGAPTVKYLLENGHRVNAFVHREDERSEQLRALGATVFVGDALKLKEVRPAMKGVDGAYFVYPLGNGLVEAAAVFAQAAKEEGVKIIANMSHKQSRPDARSQTTLNHWLSEQVFTWSGVPTTHLRITFFAQWMLYIAPLIRSGRYLTPFDADSRFAPIATRDIAKIIAGVLTNPELHANKAYVLNRPIEYSHRELAGVIGDTLGKEVAFEQVSPEEFVKILGLDADPTYVTHFSAVKIDQQEGRLEGLDSIGSAIIGGPLQTPAEFIAEHRDLLN